MAPHPSPNGNELYEFGPFRVDAQREILLRAGEPVPLTPKTFQILLVLVRHSQEIVTKDDLMKAVWPETFVEEANLSRNIFMLRKALGETPQDHRYVLTVPGRGYRLAESVHLVRDQEISVVAATHSKIEVQVSDTKPWVWIGVVTAALILAGSLGFGFWARRPPLLTDTDSLVLADFVNSTGDPVFDGTLRQGLAVQLAESPFLSLISDERIRQTLRLMQRPPDTRLTPDLAREVCERTGSVAVLEGSIASLGKDYVLGLRTKNCRNGETIDEQQLQVTRKEDVLNALGQITRKLRSRAGESLATIRKHSTPLEQATTPSLEALKAFTTARQTSFANGFAAALPHLQRAVALDPQFAMAHGLLGLMYSNLGEADLAAESTQKAYQLRHRASEREKFFIEFLYDRQVTGNLKKGQQTLQAWAEAYPRDFSSLSLLAGRVTESSGAYEKGIQAAQKDLELNPDDTYGYDALAFQFLHLGRLTEVEDTMRRAASRKLQNPDFLVLRYFLAFLNDDPKGMEEAANLTRGKPGVEDLLMHDQALVLAYSGRLRDAGILWQRAVRSAQETGNRERAAMYESAAAVCEAYFGFGPAARGRAQSALQLGKGRDVEYAVAFALALSGDSAGAQPLADDLAKRFPEDTSVQFSYLPALHALFAVAQKQPWKAIEELQPAVSYDLAFPGIAFSGKFGALYPAYVRGEAYLAARQGEKAAAEFQRILAHRSLTLADPMGAVTQLQLARALVLSGDPSGAKRAYQSFLTLWKAADSDIPIFKAAQTEYAGLQ